MGRDRPLYRHHVTRYSELGAEPLATDEPPVSHRPTSSTGAAFYRVEVLVVGGVWGGGFGVE